MRWLIGVLAGLIGCGPAPVALPLRIDTTAPAAITAMETLNTYYGAELIITGPDIPVTITDTITACDAPPGIVLGCARHGDAPALWMRPTATPAIWAHEFGHLLGVWEHDPRGDPPTLMQAVTKLPLSELLTNDQTLRALLCANYGLCRAD